MKFQFKNGNNRGERYHVLPSLAVVPLVQVASFMTLTPSNVFGNPMQARADYPTKGVAFKFTFWTWTFSTYATWSKS